MPRINLNTILNGVIIALLCWYGHATIETRERVARIEGFLAIPYSKKGNKAMPPLDVVAPGPNFSPAAYCDRNTGAPVTTMPPIMFAVHRFYETDDHQLGHDIDGRQRAVVPPEGMRDYAAYWPACAGLVDQLLRAPA